MLSTKIIGTLNFVLAILCIIRGVEHSKSFPVIIGLFIMNHSLIKTYDLKGVFNLEQILPIIIAILYKNVYKNDAHKPSFSRQLVHAIDEASFCERENLALTSIYKQGELDRRAILLEKRR